MPRNGQNIFSKPSGTTAVSGTTVESALFNQLMDDIVADLNLARPITAGGTGATTAATARANLGIEDYRVRDTFDALRADTVFTYTAGQTGTVTAGEYISTREEGLVYLVKAQADTDYNLLTVGGVRLLGVSEYAAPRIYLAIGQSNIASSNAFAAGGNLTTNISVEYWDGTAFALFNPAAGAGVPTAGNNSIAFQLGKEAARMGYKDVRLVVDAHPGEAISQWVGSGTSSPNYVSLKSAIEAALAATPGKSIIDGILWGQGESDGGGTFDLATYSGQFQTLVNQLRAELWCATTTPIAALEMPPQPAAATVNTFYVSELPYNNEPYVSTVRTSGLATGSDLLHWTGGAMNRIGPLAYELLESLPHPAGADPAVMNSPYVRIRTDTTFGKAFAFDYDTTENELIFGIDGDDSGILVNQKIRFAPDTNDIFVHGNVRLVNDIFTTDGFKLTDGSKGSHQHRVYSANDIGDQTNTVNLTRTVGETIINNTDKAQYWSDGVAATSPWRRADGGATIIPS